MLTRCLNLATRLLQYWARPFTDRASVRWQQYQWRHHADSRTFDWDWQATPYNRIAVVNLLLRHFTTPTYLEIGCASNALFSSVPVKHKIGVDPAQGGTHRMPSDAFFEHNTETFDVIFIDGLHTYDQVRRDVLNALACVRPGGWIALHDMLPRTWIEHHVPMVTQGDWTGDVWKVAIELAKTPGIRFHIVQIDHGVGVIEVLDSQAALAALNASHAPAELAPKEFDYYYESVKTLPMLSWDEAFDWLMPQVKRAC